MNTTMIAMGVAMMAGVGLVVTLGVLSLLSGALHFLFARPKLEILKADGENNFAFGFKWNAAREPAKIDTVKLRLYNPFGSPSQVSVTRTFAAKGTSFAESTEMGESFAKIVNSNGLDNSTVEVEVISSKDGVTHYFSMKARKFLEKLQAATKTVDQFNEENKVVNAKPVFTTTQRSFIADPMPASNKTLKIATNPQFAGEFAAAGGGDAAPQENFEVSKVWIEDGCIVCNACEGIYPEVFEVTDTNCIIRPDAPLNDGLKILEAAEACPVEVIQFNKA